MNKVIILLSICLCIFCQSCQDDDVEANTDEVKSGLYLDSYGKLIDGGQISDVNLYCIENHRTTIGELWYEYYPRVKTVQDYNSFKLCLMLDRDAPVYTSSDKEEMFSIYKIEAEYQRERSKFIMESYDKYKYSQKTDVEWPDLFTAFINGDLSITCDKIIFGEQPGTNLISYFSVLYESPCVPIGIENPKFLYDFGDDKPTEAANLFINGTWLQTKYYLEFSKEPDEKYEELTLSISLPMTIEHTRDIAVAKYKGLELNQSYSEAVFSSKCKIKFNWD
jgi:hypothetical protein